MKINTFLLFFFLSFAISNIGISSAFIFNTNSIAFSLDSNQTASYHFRVIPETTSNTTYEDITLFVLSPFNVVLSSYNLHLNSYADIDLVMSKRSDIFYSSGWHNNTKIIGYSGNSSKEISLSLYISNNTIINYNKNIIRNMSDGENGVFFLSFTNSGNSVINLQISENCDIINFSLSQTILPSMNLDVPVFYSVPESYQKGQYNCYFTIANFEQVNCSFYIDDKIPPKITDFFYTESINFGESMKVKVRAVDNIKVGNVTLLLGNKEYGLASIEDDFYQTLIIPTDIGDNLAVFKVCDESKNCFQYSKNIEVKVQGDYEYFEIQPYKIAVNHRYEQKIFSSKKIATFDLKLDSLKFTPDIEESENNDSIVTPPIIGFIADGKMFSIEEGQSLKNIIASEISIAIEGTQKGAYEGKLSFNLHKEYGNSKTFSFHGNIGILTIINESDFNVAGRNMHCKSVLRNTEESSTYECTTIYPLTIDLKDVSIGRSMSEIELEKENHQNQLNIIKEKYDTSSKYMWFFAISLIIIFLLFIVYVYLAEIKPIIKL